MNSKKVCLVSLGCPKNLVDAEMMLGFLKQDGFAFTSRPEEAEVIVVNTCGFIEDSKTESVDQLLEMARYKEEGRCRVLMATGCLTQRYSEELSAEMPEVDLFVGTGEFDKISSFLKSKFSELDGTRKLLKTNKFVSREQILPDPELPRLLSTPSHYAYLKISEGCSHSCSFCIIPAIRGGLKSRTMTSVVREAKSLVAGGVKELIMIGQDLNEYGRDLRGKPGQGNLAALIRSLDKIQGDFWIRPHYMYPLLFNDELIETMRDAEHVVRYIDMPLQHISERVLLSMRRGSPSRYVRQLLTKLKKEMPDLAIRTTFIVGYPGETKQEFKELAEFIQEYEFDRVGVFKYSDEEGTSAAKLPNKIEQEIKDERHAELMTIQQKISLKKHRALVGRVFKVICDGPVEKMPKVFEGRIYSQSPEIDGVTYLSGARLETGQFVHAQIMKVGEYDLVAKVVEDESQKMAVHF